MNTNPSVIEHIFRYNEVCMINLIRIRHNTMGQQNKYINDDRQYTRKRVRFNQVMLLILTGMIISYFSIQYIKDGTFSLSIPREDWFVFFIPLLYLILNWLKRTLKRRRLLRSDIYKVDKMSGTDFELMLYYYFKKLGYRVKLTPVTHDFGADLILKHKRRVTVVQAKRWNESVGIKAVQEVVGAIRYYHADEAIVITNSFFTKSAKQLAAANEVSLYDRRAVITLMEDGFLVNEDVNDKADDNAEVKKKNRCPFCNNELVIRFGNYGRFYGCSNYPSCKYTKNLKE